MNETHIGRNARGRFDIQGRKNMELDLGDNDHTKFVVVKKEMDANLPATFNGIKIEWLNAFGVRHKKTDGTAGDYANIRYTVRMDLLPTGKRLFAYYGGQVHELAHQTEGNKTKVTLEVGDPPLGWGP